MDITFPPMSSLLQNPVASSAEGIDITEIENDRSRYLRRPPLFICDPHKTGLGDRIIYPANITRHPVFCARISNAILSGQRAAFSSAGSLVLDRQLDSKECDSQLERFAKQDSPLNHEESGIICEDGRFRLGKNLANAITIDQSVVSLGSVESANYGSWLFRVLPKLAVARAMGLQDLPVLCYAPRPWQMELLRLAGVPCEKVIQLQPWRAYKIHELFIPSASNPEAYLNEMTTEFYDRLTRNLGITRKRKKLIYLSRKNVAAARNNSNTRQFLNEQELASKLEGSGFSIIEPESLQIEDQVRLFSEAAMIAGPSGSAMFNCVFSSPGTAIVDIEISKNWLHAHTNLFSSCGHAYGLAFGVTDDSDPHPVHKRWTIETSSLHNKIMSFRDVL